jgi:chromosome segregation ATPase
MADKDSSFGKLVPGFEFLQGLVKNAGQALPGLPSIGQWVAPTLNPEELEKRIEELRTVQFWLEQNARMLDATIQALEVQRMTLSTLKTMNVPLAELREALKARTPQAAGAEPAQKKGARKASPAELATPGAVDPMQWWSALTKQFTQLAAGAMKDSAGEAAKAMAGAMVKQSFDAAEQTLKKAVRAPGKVAGAVVKVARASSGGSTRGRRAAPARKSRT